MLFCGLFSCFCKIATLQISFSFLFLHTFVLSLSLSFKVSQDYLKYKSLINRKYYERAKVYVNKAFRDELYENGMYDYSYAQDASYKYEYVVVDAPSNDPS